MAEAAARVGGQPAPLADAVARAATLLGGSRQPVVAGLVSDVAGVEAAVDLARRIGAAIDHRDAAAALASLAVMQRDGWIVTTPLQLRARADAVVFVGTGIADAWPRFAHRLDAAPVLAASRGRSVLLLGPDAATAAALPAAEALPVPEADIPIVLSLSAAMLAGRPIRRDDARCAGAERIAALLRDAAYGVVAWARLPERAVTASVTLVETANRTTRCAGLPLAGSAEAAMQTCARATGFPSRVGFGRGEAEHDPWRLDTARMVDSGEADAALWLAPEPPPWGRRLPTVALGGTWPADVLIPVGTPGVDHDALLYDAEAGGLVWQKAAAPNQAPSAASVLRQILAALPC